MTQELIADALGLTSVHVNRSMRILQAAGIVATAERKGDILDFEGLQSIAESDATYLHQIAESAGAKRTGSGRS